MKAMKFKMILAIALLIPLFANAFNTEAGSVASCPGSEVAVPISVTGLNGVSAISLALSYNVDNLEYLGYQDANVALDANLLVNANNGRIMISWYSITPININSGNLLWLRFEANGESSLNWVEGLCEYADVTGNPINSTYTNGNLWVYDSPMVVSNPEDVTVYEGREASFHASANGYEISYQWQQSTNGGITWTYLQNGGCYSDVTTGTLKLNNVTLEMSGNRFRCVIGSSCGDSVLSEEASLTVNAKPTIVMAEDMEWLCNEGAYQDVMVEKFNNVGAFSLVLNIEPTVLEFVGFVNLNEGLVAENLLANQVGNKIYISYASVTGISIENGRLFSLLFNSEIGTSVNTWQTDICEIADIEGNVKTAAYEDGSMTVLSECVTQYSELQPGWNWYSTYIEQNGIDGLAMMEESLGEVGSVIASQTNFTLYYPEVAGGIWWGSLQSIVNEQTYRVNVSAPATIAITGTIANPDEHPITVSKGWNYIGYVSNVAMTVDDAFGGLDKTDGDMVKTKTAYAMYYDNYGWYGSITTGIDNTIKPGTGLMYKSGNNNAMTFTYPVLANDKPAVDVVPDERHWAADYYAYPDNMTVLAVVNLNGDELRSSDYELAAFAGDECRGSIGLAYMEPVDRYVAFLTIVGEDIADLQLALYNNQTGEVLYDTDARMQFVPNDIIGTPDNPFVVDFNANGLAESSVNVQIYPNPSKCGDRINLMIPNKTSDVRVEMLNSLGEVVLSETLSSGSVIAPDAPGIYVMKIIVDGEIISYRKMVLD